MADSKVTSLTAKSPAVSTDVTYLVDVAGGNLSKKVTQADFVGGVANTFTLDQTIKEADSTASLLLIDTIANLSKLTGRRADGTSGSKTAVQANEHILDVNGIGYGTSYSSTANAAMQFIAAENLSGTALGTYISFLTTKKTTTTLTEVFRINDDGTFFIWNPAFTQKYTLTPAAISADRVLNLPLSTGTDTILSQGTKATLTSSLPSIDKYANISTAGAGVPPIYGSTLQKAETGSADANVLTYTPPATAGTYRINMSCDVSAATSGVIGFTVSYTDSAGNAVSNVAPSLFQLGTAAPALTFTTSAVSRYYATIVININNAAANIVVKWVGGGTTTAKVSATVEQLQ